MGSKKRLDVNPPPTTTIKNKQRLKKMCYKLFEYHRAPVEPVRNTELKIFGLELEISDEYADDVLEELIEENIITVPYNMGETQHLICAEEDDSVYAELILRADFKEELVRKVAEYLAPLRCCDNHEGTSAHVHLSRNYLNTLGVHEVDIIKAAEFLYPLLYEISGRDYDSVEEWATSYIGHEEARQTIWSERARKVDNIKYSNGSRYWTVNCCNRNTIEIRIFSNAYDFNPQYIKSYLESADAIIKVAQHMKEKKYSTHHEEALQIYLQHMEETCTEIYLHSIRPHVKSPDEVQDDREIKRFMDVEQRLQLIQRHWEVFGSTPYNRCRDLLDIIYEHEGLHGAVLDTTSPSKSISSIRAQNLQTLRRYFLGC